MDKLFDLINIPLGWILEKIAGLVNGNFAASVFIFTLLINIVLIPLSLKSQKASVQQTRIKPKLDELKKRYGDDKQKYSEAMQKLYQEENVSMTGGGCLPMIFRLVLMLSIYWLILSPLTYMSGAQKTQVTNVTSAISSKLTKIKKEDESKYKKLNDKLGWQENDRGQLNLIRLIRSEDGKDNIKELLSEKEYKKIEKDLETIIQKDAESDINYNLFSEKIDLTQKPTFSFDVFNKFELIWLIPIAAFLAQMLTSVISMMIQKKNNPDAPSMAGMMLTMPLLSLWIGFTLPAGVGFYWICSSLIGGFIQSGLQLFYGPHRMLASERAKELAKRRDFELTQLKKFSEHNIEE